MNFDEEVQKLSVQIQQRKSHITNEEMTKHSLIIPFIQLLGFDVFTSTKIPFFSSILLHSFICTIPAGNQKAPIRNQF